MILYLVLLRLWQVFVVDFFEFQGQDYFVIIDYYLNFFEVDKFVSKIFKEVIEKFKFYMVRYGILDKIVIDNGFYCSLQEFKKFKDLYEFDYVISFFIYLQLNGKVENVVKIVQ